jgi:hypothetical protein
MRKQLVSPCLGDWNVVVVSPLLGANRLRNWAQVMPSLFRFLATVGIVAGLVYGGMLALAYWVDPKPREITVSVPPEKFSKQR